MRRRGYQALLKAVSKGTDDPNEQLARLQEASKNGAHPDDVAAVRTVIWSEHERATAP